MVTRGRIGVSVQEVSQALAQSFGRDRPVDALLEQIRLARDTTGSAVLLIQRAATRLFVPLELKKTNDG